MRDMQELQKSHVLKVEDLSRRKLTEDFEEVSSFFQVSNVETVYILGDDEAKYPDAEIDDVHTRNSLASPLYLLLEREASETTIRSGSFLERQGNNCSQKQNPRSWDVNTERILPKIIFVNWSYTLILKQWKLGILEQGMNSSDENKLCFTKNWQIENEHFVILVFEVFKKLEEFEESRDFD